MNAVSSVSELKNLLLAALPREEHERLTSLLVPIHLPRGRIICETGDLVRYVYFPSSGVISLLSTTAEGETIEVGMVGNEGTTGIPVIHAREMPYRAVVQIPVDALRGESTIIRRECARGGQLNDLLLSYTHSLFTQFAQSAVCNRFHSAEQRFCRWLLSTHDRVHSNTIDLTHEGISYMLGTQRSVVSTVAASLQREGLIGYTRGSIRVIDRKGLEAYSCECYQVVRELVGKFGKA
jgi:CRP-like cAMP-binding protein